MSGPGSGAEDGVTTGVRNLDPMLGGGYPAEGTVLVRGDPGAGKSTFGGAFLQAGLEADERALFVAPAHTEAAVRNTMAVLDPAVAESVHIASLRETVGAFLDSASEATSDSLEGMLTQYGSPDRIVVDDVRSLPRTGWSDVETESVSDPETGLDRVIRRIAQIGTDLGATTLVLTTRSGEWDMTVPTAPGIVDGIIDLRWDRTEAERRRLVSILKLRSRDFDTRAVELLKHDGTLAVTAGEASVPDELRETRFAPTDIPGLDTLLGGGLVLGGSALLQHDGRVQLGPLYASLIANAVQRDQVVEVVPTIHLREQRLRETLGAFDLDVDDLLADNRMFVFDLIGAWEAGQPNVFGAREEFREIQSMLEGIADRTDGAHFRIVNADGLVHTIGVSDARKLRAFQESSLLGPEDQILYLQNPDAVESTAVAAYEDAAEQIIHLGHDDGSRQNVTLRKSPTAGVGSRGALNFTNDPPYVAVGRVGLSE